ncbi:testicular haploid expressed gene protein-like [Alligator mississippiensis]|nr:testicular haploid expressed gene protein-like [Alligator mississippiensis]
MNLGFPSDRILKLAEPKKFQLAYLQKRARNSPEWPVTPAALTCEASQRVLDLAHPKSMHPDFIQAREAETHVTDTAKTARVSQRIKHLAQPRVQKDSWCYDRGHPEAVIWPVSKSAQQATANSRTSELAKAKQVSPKYLPVRDAEWPVSKAAKHTAATPRTVELSKPSKKPPMNIAQLNPDAFTVKESAKKAFCSSRILELARPIAR